MTTAEKLADARLAYHKLMTGALVVELQDSNGERVRYTAADRDALKKYIDALQAEVDGSSPGPLQVYF